MIDFHSHVLPGMDDGSKNIEESIKMLEASMAQGVETIVATPHFFPWKEKPEDFLARRDSAIKALPQFSSMIRAGAEVAYYDGIDYSEEIERLSIDDTDFILIEMPMTIWSRRMIEALHTIEKRTRLKVVLAHLERYFQVLKKSDHLDYVCENFLVQVNADHFCNHWTQRKALKLVKDGTVDFVGSDCHNMTSRPPNMGEAYQTIEKKLGIKSMCAFKDKQKKFLEGGQMYER